jgi:formylglycine-generating enzyme required for sulfatase activity
MVKGKPWTPATLQKVHGLEGLGVLFLEETFSVSTAPVKHRRHEKSAQGVFKALLPELGQDIKGNRRTYQDLQEAAGYSGRTEDFQELLQILDAELRIVTPTGPAGGESSVDGSLPRERSRYYQLTHDYLVHSLRAWMNEKQQATRRGRALLTLAERADAWHVRRDNRFLPSWLEWAKILLWTRPRDWNEPQRKLMHAANRYHVTQSLVALMFFTVLAVAGILLRRQMLDVHGAAHANELVAEIKTFHTPELSRFQAEIERYRPWTMPRLEALIADPATVEVDRLRARLALLTMDASQVGPLAEALQHANPHEVMQVATALLPYKAEVVPTLWRQYAAPEADANSRFRDACALATLDPENARWHEIGPDVVTALLEQEALNLGQWLDALRPVKRMLLPTLQRIFRTSKRTRQRALATEALATVAADQPEVLAELVLEADQAQFQRLLPLLLAHRSAAAALMNHELDQPPTEQETEAARDAWAKRQARAAFVLLQLGQDARVWPLWQTDPDPSVRTYLMHLLTAQGASPRLLFRRWEQDTDPSVRRALLRCLGQYDPAVLEPELREALIRKLVAVYRDDPDAGNHSVAGWLVRQRWGRGKELEGIDEAAAGKPPGARRWLVNGQGQTFTLIEGPVEFWMGSPVGEAGHLPDETLHRRRISRSFAIADQEVTVDQFSRFLQEHPAAFRTYTKKFRSEHQGPFIALNWYEAAMYCRWVSEQEKVPEDQMCFPPLAEIKEGMKLPADYLKRTGYRLPTEAEWEYACRAGTRTSRWYGTTPELLDEVAWYYGNSQGHAWHAGLLKPNDLGLFDVYGNASEWCLDRYAPYPVSADGQASEDQEDRSLVILSSEIRAARGGSFNELAADQRSAARFPIRPMDHPLFIGLRLARTYYRSTQDRHP